MTASKILLLPAIFLLFCSAKPSVYLDNEEAQKAFGYLNQVRQNPNAYSKEIGVNLRKVKPLAPLIWNDTLAKVAQAKAIDMAENNYFSHTNKKGQGINILIYEAGYAIPESFYKKKGNNFFESLAMGQENGIDVIKALIKDKGVNPPAHRQHLLGLTDFWAACYDIGIGFVRTNDPQRRTYTCIIIARHEAFTIK